MTALDSFEVDGNALASVLYPQDPGVVSDKAAGDLIDPQTGASFARFVFRMIRYLDRNPLYIVGALGTIAEAITIFTELDARAASIAGAGTTFADLPSGEVTPPFTAGTQEAVVFGTDGISGYINGATTPISTNLTAAEFGVIFGWMAKAFAITYWANIPYATFRKNQLALATDDGSAPPELDNEVVFVGPLSDAANLISCPRQPLSGSGLDYVTWWFPFVKSIADQAKVAFLEVVNDPAGSETALNGASGLITEEAAQTLYLRTS